MIPYWNLAYSLLILSTFLSRPLTNYLIIDKEQCMLEIHDFKLCYCSILLLFLPGLKHVPWILSNLTKTFRNLSHNQILMFFCLYFRYFRFIVCTGQEIKKIAWIICSNYYNQEVKLCLYFWPKILFLQCTRRLVSPQNGVNIWWYQISYIFGGLRSWVD